LREKKKKKKHTKTKDIEGKQTEKGGNSQGKLNKKTIFQGGVTKN